VASPLAAAAASTPALAGRVVAIQAQNLAMLAGAELAFDVRAAVAAPAATGRSVANLPARLDLFSSMLIAADVQPLQLATAGSPQPAVAAATPQAAAEAAGEIASAVVSAAPARAVHIARFGSRFTLLADLIASFAEESASIPAAAAAAATRDQAGPRKAWIVTGTVLAVDVVLLSYAYRHRTKDSSPRRRRPARLNTFDSEKTTSLSLYSERGQGRGFPSGSRWGRNATSPQPSP
jgi:hypothetical protein